MPVEAHDGRIVREFAIRRVQHGADQVLHGFSRVHLGPADDRFVDVDAGGVAVEHAVGEDTSRSPARSDNCCTR
jgi:hypothetical protein